MHRHRTDLLSAGAIGILDGDVGSEPGNRGITSLLLCFLHGSLWHCGNCLHSAGAAGSLAVWLALVIGAAPLIAFWPLLSALKAHYSAHLWIHYVGPSVPMTYGSFFHAGGAFGLSVLAVCAAGVIAARMWPKRIARRPGNG